MRERAEEREAARSAESVAWEVARSAESVAVEAARSAESVAVEENNAEAEEDQGEPPLPEQDDDYMSDEELAEAEAEETGDKPCDCQCQRCKGL